jgi:hypothetical protein
MTNERSKNNKKQEKTSVRWYAHIQTISHLGYNESAGHFKDSAIMFSPANITLSNHDTQRKVSAGSYYNFQFWLV